MHLLTLLVVSFVLIVSETVRGQAEESIAAAFPVEKLPPGHVRGDVVSYSYVPNRYWGRAESIGKLPYLFEYAVMAHEDGTPLEKFHEENVRRIDLASQWSTCMQLYNRCSHYHDEIINLMLRCYRNRQLIILSATPNPKDREKDAFENLIKILETLWARRDQELISPEGDRATGRQLINNILMANLGDEGLHILKTSGLENLNREFAERIGNRRMGSERPFTHIKTWYNQIMYGLGGYAANEEDLAAGRYKWPPNSEFIGVDAYHFWSFDRTPFDPADPKVPPQRIAEWAINWQNVVTRYYGPDFRVTNGAEWDPRYKNDTHAMLQAIELAGANRAMMIYIANSDYIPGSCYTTPIETMDAFYHSIKAGPWMGLSWWLFACNEPIHTNTLDYIDKRLIHYTPQHKEGIPYAAEELERYRKRLIESRMRMFNDVVYNQFKHLNGTRPEDGK